MVHDRSLLASDPTFPPCTNLSREERLAEKRRRQALVDEARSRGFGPTGRPEQWRTVRWPAEDSGESILAWLRWALGHLTHTLLPELEVPSAYRSDALLLVHHLACKGIYAPEGLPVGDDIASVRALLEKLARWLEGELGAGIRHETGRAESSGASRKTRTPTKAKRSTVKGEGQEKLIAALTQHHQYSDGGCLNDEPIRNNELARMAEVSRSTASAFFDKHFGGHLKYRAVCADAGLLVASLKLLNNEYSPLHLFGANPPGEDGREDDR